MRGIQSIKAKDIAKYALLPGIIPRINAFINSGFGWLAFTMAIIYNGVRLLPTGHPYLSTQNIGKFGIRHVIAEAANNLEIKKENIDQIIIFFALLLGFILLILQFVSILIGFFIKPAAALGVFAGLFTTPNCTTLGQNANCTDIAFMMLDKVFAVPNVFNSAFAPAGTALGDIPVFNRALQELFQYYSYAILIVGLVIFLYYIIVIVGETAQSGTPFGRRFSHIYAPLRLVIAIGLLVPLNYGLNSAQYITLYAAKFGSGFATNGWIIFNNELAAADTPVGTHQESLIARPKIPDITHLVSFMSIVKTCKIAYEKSYPIPSAQPIFIEPWLAKNDGTPSETWTNYRRALEFFGNRDVVITFGMRYPAGANTNENYIGDVRPYCGQITVHTNVGGSDATGAMPLDQRLGPWKIQEAFFVAIQQLWNLNDLTHFGNRLTAIHVGIPDDPCTVGAPLPGDCKQPPEAEWKNNVANFVRLSYETFVVAAYNQMVALGGSFYDIPPELLDRGWGGAAIWYNHIAEWNGSLFTAALNAPTPSLMPEVMKKIEEERRSHNEAVDSENRYEPTVQGFRAISNLDGNKEMPIAKALSSAYKYWMTDGKGQPSDSQTSGNVFFDLLNAVFGVGGLFTIRENDDVHPLAQLAALGKSIIESAIRNLLTALVFSAGGGMGEIVGEPHLGPALHSISSMFVSFTTIGLTIGFILYYVLPFLPFMYFFFAVGGWVKTIFEAMVGVPLWALAHLRIDGNGLPGDAAMNGYFLIFEIFVRPILTVFGLIAGMAIFAAMARTLNGIFDLVVENLAGFDCTDCTTAAIAGIEYKRNVIDEFFFTIIYTILVYMLAISSFKMIDQVPNGILRWMGAGVQTFGDQRDDPAQGMVSYAAFGGAQMAGEITGALQQGARAVGQGVGLPFGLLSRNMGKEVTLGSGTSGSLTPK